jgi:phosphatidylserine/phosphatidylglycerophosphate/cardiolipin synthase-like enzyme
LMFNPGPVDTLLNAIVDRTTKGTPSYDESLYIHGVLNQDPSTAAHPVSLFHRGEQEDANFDVVLPAAITEQLGTWVKELKQMPGTFAMVHSKVIVIDPFGETPIVMTGSHNLGPKASGSNDDNLVIVEGAPELAAAYSVNIIGVYNQYRWRFWRTQNPGDDWTGLQDNDTWQDDYFTGARARELSFWLAEG